jgi:hypothetical protein
MPKSLLQGTQRNKAVSYLVISEVRGCEVAQQENADTWVGDRQLNQQNYKTLTHR